MAKKMNDREQIDDGLPPNTAADIADGVEYPLEEATVVVVRLTALICVASIAAPLWFAVLVISLLAPAPAAVKALLLIGLATVSAVATFWATWWPRVRYRHIRYRTDERGFTIHRGVLWRGVTSIPKARVQHTDVVQGPIQRRFGLGKLVIYTAGTQDASVSLSGLSHAKALLIRDFLIESSDDEDA
jgi:membrane protein YdbS with pleckstrin-like domain